MHLQLSRPRARRYYARRSKRSVTRWIIERDLNRLVRSGEISVEDIDERLLPYVKAPMGMAAIA